MDQKKMKTGSNTILVRERTCGESNLDTSEKLVLSIGRERIQAGLSSGLRGQDAADCFCNRPLRDGWTQSDHLLF
jgi:hypothetical protein